MKRKLYFAMAVCCLAMLSVDARGALFVDDLDDPGALGVVWGKNASSSDNTTTFGYDYSADGIPEAPNNLGGAATTGVKLEANNTDFDDTTGEFFSLYPIGQNFTGKYQVKFDSWQNYSTFDRENDGGNGTTEFLGGGIGYDGVSADVGSGHVLINTNEGGSGSDYRAFKGATFLGHGDMVAGSRNATGSGPNFAATSALYQGLFPAGSGVPPAAQGQTGTPNENRGGTPGFQWVTHTISVDGDIIRHSMTNQNGDSRNIVVYDNTVLDPNNVVPTDGNIMIFYADFFSSVSPSAGVTFGLVDNVIVSIPEPATAMLSMGGLGWVFTRRRRQW